MSDIRFNQWLHQSGTGGVSQDHIGNIGIGTTNPSIVVSAANTAVLNVGVITANNLFVNNAFNGDITGNVTGNISGATGTFSGNVDIADKIIHTGDTDTAMRFPADNTFAVDTAGSERLRITSTGAVQITGVDDQDNLLVKASNTHFAIHQDDSDGEVSLRAQDGSGSNNTKYMTFFTEGGSGTTERLRITSDGKLLIGSDTGSVHGNRLLQVGKTDRSETYVSIVSSTSGESGLLFADTTTNDTGGYRGQIRYHHSDDSMNFRTGAAERLRITSTARFGFNTSNPPRDYCFHSAQADTNIQITNNTTGVDDSAGALIQQDGNDFYIWNKENSFMSLGTNAAERVRIQPSGYVGIGENAPGGKLTVKHANTATSGLNATLKLKQGVATNGNRSSLIFSSLDDYDVAAVNGVVEVHSGTSANNVGRLEFWTKASGSNAGERLRIESSGRVVIHGDGTIRTSWPGAVCSVNNLAMMDAGSGFSWGLRANSGDTQWCLERIVGNNSFSDSNIKFRVYNNGNYMFAGSNSSDRDIKENIEDISGTSLNLIDQLRPRTFNFKESEGYSTEPKTGFVAQEIGAVIPSIVNGTDGQKDMGVDYNGLVAHLVKAVQELKAENDSLRSRLDTAGL